MQRQIGVPVPAELIASLLRHNGAGTTMLGFILPPFYIPMSTHSIISDAKMMCDILVSNGHNDSVGSCWHGQVIPVALDGGGGNLLLDQRRGRNGRLGDHDEETYMMFDQWPPTLTDLMEQTATALETGERSCRTTVLRSPRRVSWSGTSFEVLVQEVHRDAEYLLTGPRQPGLRGRRQRAVPTTVHNIPCAVSSGGL